jgi:tripartite-type tricarboxylate transporter receptor subunit TctC
MYTATANFALFQKFFLLWSRPMNLRCVVFLLASLAIPVFAQPAYPTQAIKIIVPYAAGGGADMLARLVGQRLGDRLKQQVIVDNRGGGSNTIGINAVAKSTADGHTLGLVTPVFVMTPSLMKDHPYDPLKDLAPVGMVGTSPLVLTVHPDVKANTVREFIALGKAKPGVLNFASLGPATTQGLAGTLFNSMAGIQATPIPYKGSSPGVTDLLAGNVQYMFNGLPSMMPQIKAGKLRALGVSGTERSAVLPDVPVIADAVPGYDVTTWYGFVVPAGTPKAVVALLNRELMAIVQQPDVREKLATAGIDPKPMTVDATAAMLKAESVKWAKVIRDENIKPE